MKKFQANSSTVENNYYALGSIPRDDNSLRNKAQQCGNIEEPLTNNLTKDKTMANLYYTDSPELAECFTTNFGKVKKSSQTTLQSTAKFGIISTQSQKTTAEPGNSNYLSLAHSTPQACFFMRGLHTPKENSGRKNALATVLSMVACSGKGFALCCVPVIAVFQPVTRYRPKPGNFRAVTLEKLFTGVTQMYQFIFAAIRRTDLTNHIQKIRINADSEQQARAILAREFVLILAGKINLKNDRTFSQGGVYA
ncbi:host cell division inhibitor Icd-like protein [Rodentibacter rarus]|uniref:host cell division inhibitor Icd-like protein n=1 Tax=Rodentibacter rarus TaxID=1908260 RepID=UPI001FC90946|nr:host cell division inhibitor Icd-like protein [Rodentibacter rarus]